MQSKKVILVAGGDLRQKYVAKRLAEMPEWQIAAAGFSAKTLESAAVHCCADDLHDAEPYDVLVLPIPASADGLTVHTPFGEKPLSLEQLAAHGKDGALVLGGACGTALQKLFAKAGMEVQDYLKREELCISNAIPTAEGAIQIAMEETAATLHGNRALVIGYGRIGSALAPRLRSLGMDVTVCARSCEARALAQTAGCRAISPDALHTAAPEQMLICNTAPALVLDETILQTLSSDTLVIDLASRPGGTDFAAAKRRGTRVVWALSLPPRMRR